MCRYLSSHRIILGLTAAILMSVGYGQVGNFPAESVDIAFNPTPAIPPADATTGSIVSAAQAFLGTLSNAQREAVSFSFEDNGQRAGWSNLPVGIVPRHGLPRAELNADQLAALDSLLQAMLSDAGMRNARLQMAADDSLIPPGNPMSFGSGNYYIAFLGEPALDAPWMLQFGGHHLALNTTFAGPQASFSPMLTGGQPIRFEYQGEQVDITREETDAARALLASLDPGQKASAVRGDSPAELLLGPGEYGTVIAPEGISGAELTAAQQELLLAVVRARVGHFNARDAEAKMAAVRASIDNTYFGWWGPQDAPGAAYFRITGPDIFMEYAPQALGGDPTNHIHSMYRDPGNDYGTAWLEDRR